MSHSLMLTGQILLSCGLLGLFGSLAVVSGAVTDHKKPNIVFILADDLGWGELGYNGATYYETPSIDALAQRSLALNRSYARPTCSPSRASLFTGLNAAHTGIYHVAAYARVDAEHMQVQPPESGHHVTAPIEMIADQIAAAGYATGYVGKWHVTKDPTEQGFVFNAGGWSKGGPASYFSPYKNKHLTDGPKGEYLPDRLADEAIGFIGRHASKPFFLCYAPYSVHWPLQARDADISRFRNREKEHERQSSTYAAMVFAMDRAIGRVLSALEEAGVADQTVIILTSDNGSNGRATPAGELRGSKGTVYEGGIRVPTLVSWPGVVAPRVSHALVDIIDWYPTLIDISGARRPSHQLDGLSLVPLLTGNVDQVRSTLHMHVPVYNGVTDQKNYINRFFHSPATVSLTERYKYVRRYDPQYIDELYDLGADPGEAENIAESHPELMAELGQVMDGWLRDNDAVLPQPKL